MHMIRIISECRRHSNCAWRSVSFAISYQVFQAYMPRVSRVLNTRLGSLALIRIWGAQVLEEGLQMFLSV